MKELINLANKLNILLEAISKSLDSQIEVQQAIINQVNSFDEIKNHLIINNHLISKQINTGKDKQDKLLSELEIICKDAYANCYDFQDFVSIVRRHSKYHIDYLREWYDEETARLV